MNSRKENTPPRNTNYRFFVSKSPSLATIHENNALDISSLPMKPSPAEQSLSESLQNVKEKHTLLERAISNSEQYSKNYLLEALTVYGEAINETEEPFKRVRDEFKKMKVTEAENRERVLNILNFTADYIKLSHHLFTERKNLLTLTPKLG